MSILFKYFATHTPCTYTSTCTLVLHISSYIFNIHYDTVMKIHVCQVHCPSPLSSTILLQLPGDIWYNYIIIFSGKYILHPSNRYMYIHQVKNQITLKVFMVYYGILKTVCMVFSINCTCMYLIHNFKLTIIIIISDILHTQLLAYEHLSFQM